MRNPPLPPPAPADIERPPARDGNPQSRYGGCPDGRCMHSGYLHAKLERAVRLSHLGPHGRGSRTPCVVRSCPCSPLTAADLMEARTVAGVH